MAIMTLDGIKERLALARVMFGLTALTDFSLLSVAFNAWGDPQRAGTAAISAVLAVCFTAVAVGVIIYTSKLIRRMENDHA